eukprot:g12371.t1
MFATASTLLKRAAAEGDRQEQEPPEAAAPKRNRTDATGCKDLGLQDAADAAAAPASEVASGAMVPVPPPAEAIANHQSARGSLVSLPLPPSRGEGPPPGVEKKKARSPQMKWDALDTTFHSIAAFNAYCGERWQGEFRSNKKLQVLRVSDEGEYYRKKSSFVRTLFERAKSECRFSRNVNVAVYSAKLDLQGVVGPPGKAAGAGEGGSGLSVAAAKPGPRRLLPGKKQEPAGAEVRDETAVVAAGVFPDAPPALDAEEEKAKALLRKKSSRDVGTKLHLEFASRVTEENMLLSGDRVAGGALGVGDADARFFSWRKSKKSEKKAKKQREKAAKEAAKDPRKVEKKQAKRKAKEEKTFANTLSAVEKALKSDGRQPTDGRNVSREMLLDMIEGLALVSLHRLKNGTLPWLSLLKMDRSSSASEDRNKGSSAADDVRGLHADLVVEKWLDDLLKRTNACHNLESPAHEDFSQASSSSAQRVVQVTEANLNPSLLRVARIFATLNLIHEMLLQNRVCTQRELFYRLKSADLRTGLFTEQTQMNKTIEDVVLLLLQLKKIPRAAFGVVTSENKGLLATRLVGVTFDGVQYPELRVRGLPVGEDMLKKDIDLNLVANMGLKAVLVVEKETVFFSLLESSSQGVAEGAAAAGSGGTGSEMGTGSGRKSLLDNVVMVTAKGYPDVVTRKLLRKLETQYPLLPFLYLGDCDPHGLHIYLTYKKTLPNLKSIGVHTSDILGDTKHLYPGMPLNAKERKMLRAMETENNYVLENDRLRKEVVAMRECGSQNCDTKRT